MDKHIISKDRVAAFGEVFTGIREVDAMLDLVKQETERIDSRFLEPACGTGNFLAEILRRKLSVVENRYAKSKVEYERNAILAVSSIYGIDIQEENVLHCRDRLFGIFEKEYLRLFKNETDDRCRESVNVILVCNIIHGNALSMMTEGDNPTPIVIPEWSFISNSRIKRRDFNYQSIVQNESMIDLPVFGHISDLGEDTYIPIPVQDYPPVHYLNLGSEAKKQDIVEDIVVDIVVDIVEATSCRFKEMTRQDDGSTIPTPQDDGSTLDTSTLPPQTAKTSKPEH
ncbi:MAG: DNA methyltransferase [Candidatus Cloacimonadota bacterium]